MSVQWNVKQDLDLMRRVYQRALAEKYLADPVDASRQTFTLSDRENNPLVADITLPLLIARGVKGHLTSTVSTTEMTIDDIVESAREFAEAMEQIDAQRPALVEEITELRKYLVKRVRSLRAKGSRISGEIGIGAIPTNEANDVWPVVTLHFPGEDLRPGSFSFVPEGRGDIAAQLDDLTDVITTRSELLDGLDKIDAVGLVHPIVHDALDKCEGGTAPALAQIFTDPDHLQRVTDEHENNLILYWEEGILTGTIPISDGIRFVKGAIHFDAMPCSASEIQRGASLASIIVLPCLAEADARIFYASGDKGERGYVSFTVEPMLFDREGNLL